MGLQFLASAELVIFLGKEHIFFCISFALDLILSLFTSVSLMEDTEIGWKMQHSCAEAIYTSLKK